MKNESSRLQVKINSRGDVLVTTPSGNEVWVGSGGDEQRGIDWINQYLENGPPTPDQMIAESFKYWPDLFSTRIAVINHLFFVIGNGFQWFDGAVLAEGGGILAPLDQYDVDVTSDDFKPYYFYPVCKYSKICNIPDDVRPDWLAFAFEAALRLRYQNDPDPEDGWENKNVEYGESLPKKIWDRFPEHRQLLKGVERQVHRKFFGASQGER